MNDPSFAVSRTVDAPVDQVWNAWKDPGQIRRWWGPQGFTGTTAEVDFREGGRTLVGMTMEGGPEFCNTWSYTAIIEQERIEFVSRFADRTGAEIDPAQLGMPPGVPKEVRHVVTFEERGDGTEVTVEEYDYEPGPILEQSRTGQEQVMDKLAALFPAT
jgi:uncharacterized protein YndB with AHSA1/START domain